MIFFKGISQTEWECRRRWAIADPNFDRELYNEAVFALDQCWGYSTGIRNPGTSSTDEKDDTTA